MKCDFKYCMDCDSTEIMSVGNKKYHTTCKKDMDDLKKTADLYLKYYNNLESWSIMMRSLNNWYLKYGAEYILYTMCMAIRQRARMNNFYSLYYLLNNLTYRKKYEDFKSENDMYKFEVLYMKMSEYQELLTYMNGNSEKLEYYMRKLSDYIQRTGKEYSSHYQTIKNWYDKEELSKPVITQTII